MECPAIYSGSSPTLTNVTFSGNSASQYGGGIYHFNHFSPTLINTILWDNSASTGTEIYNNSAWFTIVSSLIKGRAEDADKDARLNSAGLTNNGCAVQTIAIAPGSSAINAGLYVKRSADGTLHYSDNNSRWFSDPALTTAATPSADAVNLSSTDAMEYSSTGRSDMGAYEYRAIAP